MICKFFTVYGFLANDFNSRLLYELLILKKYYLKGEKFRGIKFRGFRVFLLNPRNVSRKFFRPAKITSPKLNFFSRSNREIREIFRP